MVVIPDPQMLVQYFPDAYRKMCSWIADNKESLDLQAVLHMGDMVNNSNRAVEWTVAKEGMDIIDASGVPWMPMRGNHDLSKHFNKTFPYDQYGTMQPWFGGSYHADKLDHTWWTFEVGNRSYLILSLGWAPTWDVVEWAEGIIQANPDKNVILTVHAYMFNDGTLMEKDDPYSIDHYYAGEGYPEGVDLWARFKQYENVVMASSGHINYADIRTYIDTNAAGRDVSSILADAQNLDLNSPYGMLMLLTFQENSDAVTVNWYSTYYDALYRSRSQFALEVPHVNEEYTTLKEDLTARFDSWTAGGPVQYADGIGYGENGYSSGANTNLKYSDYVSVEGYDMLRLTICGRSGHSATGGFAFYTDADTDAFISAGAAARNGNGVSTNRTEVRTVAVPEGAKYIRVTYWEDSTSYAIAVPFSCVGYADHTHSYTFTVTAPTCTEQGYTTYTCTCGDSYTASYVNALEHDCCAGLCTVCGEDTVTTSRDGNSLSLAGELAEGTRIIVASYDGDGRFIESRFFIWQGSPITEEVPNGEMVTLFFMDENWSPLRRPICPK